MRPDSYGIMTGEVEFNQNIPSYDIDKLLENVEMMGYDLSELNESPELMGGFLKKIAQRIAARIRARIAARRGRGSSDDSGSQGYSLTVPGAQFSMKDGNVSYVKTASGQVVAVPKSQLATSVSQGVEKGTDMLKNPMVILPLVAVAILLLKNKK